MAEMTSSMYGALGKLGKTTYYRRNGKTIAREIVPVKNPKTTLQTVQRVIAKQVSKSYSKFRKICDHSFEGISFGANSMAKFRSFNMKALRDRAVELNNAGQSLAQFYNFQPITSEKWVPGSLILSQGQLSKIVASVGTTELGLYVGKLPASENTYAGVAAALGARRGDQITIISVEKQDGEYVVFESRVILDPRNGDGSSAPMSSVFCNSGVIVNPNWRNDTHFTYLEFATDHIEFTHGANGATLVAAAAIASRKSGDNWLRSNSTLAVSEAACGTDLYSLLDAVENSYESGTLDVESEYYLNNAGEGGAQGDIVSPTPGDDSPVVSNNIIVNGVQQGYAGGGITATAPITSVVFAGANLANAEASAVVSGQAGTIQPTSKTASQIAFTGLSVAAGSSIVITINGTQYTVNAQSAQGGDSGSGGNTGSMTITSANGQNKSIGGSLSDTNDVLTLGGTNMSGTWTAENGNNSVSGTVNGAGTEVTFNVAGEDVTWTIKFNGSSVFTYYK